ncbi:hypothetical protein LSTR_LSTR005359 [Laodelphax striatellus]|uniref:Lysosomal protein NCU-G1 n=1 Tax=Laodelphax striatellus TaxID=195883 RepID=A0A482WVD4_LAOST|nr:hypothetical protein LSTR_LSTR005359 [Laodelphax striatellus]
MLKLGLFFVVIFSLSYISAHERKLSTYVNPGCSLPPGSTRTCDDLLLVHIRSEGASDTLHHIWDFSRHPSLMLALTEKNSSLRVDWPAYVGAGAHSVSFTSRPLYVISVVVAGIIEFNDTDDSGAMRDATNQESRLIGIDGVQWRLVQPITNDSNTVLMAVEAQLANHTDANGTAPVQITMGAFGGEKRDSDLPHMLHSSNMSQMDITLDHLPPTYPRSRFGVSLLAATSDPGNATLRYADTRNIDDEYAPGVFKMVELLSSGVKSQKFELLDDDDDSSNSSSEIQYGGYVQWRPVVYTAPSRDDSQATRSVHYGIAACCSDLSQLRHMLPYKLFGNDSDVAYQMTNVTFGQPEDGFYNKTRFASWTFVVGIGSPAEETLSSFVMHMVLLGLGLPLVLVVLGMLCITVRRLIQNKDDFFLSQ